jgi:glyoxylase-like metal-dependent hydrolase (beta-lactamase superfamily II)
VTRRYYYKILQNGTLPLTPDGNYDRMVEHRCTTVLIWPEGESPSRANTVIVDPCFTARGFAEALAQLQELNLTFGEIGWLFVTHRHKDHHPNVADFGVPVVWRPFQSGKDQPWPNLQIQRHRGHTPDLQTLTFSSATNQQVCVTGDAILGERWLRAWKYYWPNGYSPAEIVQTWESVALIVAMGDLIIPGHGQPFPVKKALVQDLLAHFADAEYADDCQEVVEILKRRRKQLCV